VCAANADRPSASESGGDGVRGRNTRAGRSLTAPRPLDRLRSIKVKLAVVIVGSVAASLYAVILGWQTGIRPRWLVLMTGITALTAIQFLAHGMTGPLRDMARASRAMAAGDYTGRVTTRSRDEVGELADAFNSMSSRLAEVDAERHALIANVSHELRTPLAGARARLENIVDGVEPATPERLGAVLRSIERMGRLVDDLLDLSRLEAGVVPIHRERVNVRDLVDAVAEEVSLTAEVSPTDDAPLVEVGSRAGVAPDLRIDVPSELSVDADPARLHQVLANLVANALVHGSGPVEISADRRAGVIRLVVADRGPGLDSAERAAVFDRFHRGEAATAGGTGLGLAIARWVVELHGGSIRLEPNTPTGLRSVVELPDPTT
jgi:signal transduction histidine kinase